MDQLKVTDGPALGRTFPLDPARMYVIGRDQAADLPFPDPSMSRQHAGLAFKAGRGWVLTNASQHGLLVGGTLVKEEAVLAAGVPITIGGSVMILEVGLPGTAPPAPVAAGKPAPVAAPAAAIGGPVAVGGPVAGAVAAAGDEKKAAAGPSWVPPCCCGCASYMGCAALTWGLTMGISAGLWEARVQREMNAEDTMILASILAPILGLLFGLVVLALMRMRENRKAA